MPFALWIKGVDGCRGRINCPEFDVVSWVLRDDVTIVEDDGFSDEKGDCVAMVTELTNGKERAGREGREDACYFSYIWELLNIHDTSVCILYFVGEEHDYTIPSGCTRGGVVVASETCIV